MPFISLDLFDSGYPVHEPPDAGSCEHMRIENAPYACRWCGRDLLEPFCPGGCGHIWVCDMRPARAIAQEARQAQLRQKLLEL